MNWDLVIMAAQTVFVIGTLPMIFAREKPTLWSGAPSAVALWANATGLCASDLWFGGLMCAGAALEWTILAVQRYQLNTKRGQAHFPLSRTLEIILLRD